MSEVAAVNEASSAVQRLFEANGGLGRFVLPDGELGRPGDNLYRLTFIAARPRKLLVELDDQLLLIVTGPELEAGDSQRVRLRFAQLTFDWQEYGNLRPHVSTYTADHIDFVGQG